MAHPEGPTIDPAETAHFDRSATNWWNASGPLASLHSMTPVRLDYVLGHVAPHFGRELGSCHPLDGLRVLDAGCGGGLLAEPLARLGASVVGIDPVASAIRAAESHAGDAGLEIDYRVATIETLKNGDNSFDLILASEVVEHLADVPVFLQNASRLLARDGLLVLTTLNRTRKSLALAVVGAEWLLGWLPRGTHDWRKFLRPQELERTLRDAGLTAVHRAGLVYQPLSATWRIDERDLAVNYAMVAIHAAAGAGSGT